jgi:hypothetical protein
MPLVWSNTFPNGIVLLPNLQAVRDLVRSDPDGGFLIHGLAPGAYRIIAWEEVSNDLVMDPAFRSSFDDRAVTVTLEEASQVGVDLVTVGRDAIAAAEARLP